MLCSPDYVRRIASASHVSTEDDWLFDCVLPNADDTFDVGMDIARCPVAELCSRIGVECFFPYFCVNDYITHDVLVYPADTDPHIGTRCFVLRFPADKRAGSG